MSFKKLGLLDQRKFIAQTSDAFTMVDAGGASYPQQHGVKPRDIKKIIGPLQKLPRKQEDGQDDVSDDNAVKEGKGVAVPLQTTEPVQQLWDKEDERFMKIVKKTVKTIKNDVSSVV